MLDAGIVTGNGEGVPEADEPIDCDVRGETTASEPMPISLRSRSSKTAA